MEFQLLLASIHSSPRFIEPLCVGGKGERERDMHVHVHVHVHAHVNVTCM